MRVAVLIDEKDNRIGKLTVPDACFVIRHKEATFYRTDKTVRLHHSHRSTAVAFEETQPFVRDRLEAI
jgi:hypothetical protein